MSDLHRLVFVACATCGTKAETPARLIKLPHQIGKDGNPVRRWDVQTPEGWVENRRPSGWRTVCCSVACAVKSLRYAA